LSNKPLPTWKAMIGESILDESSYVSSGRVAMFLSLGFFLLFGLFGVVFAIFKNSVGTTFCLGMATAAMGKGVADVFATQRKSAQVLSAQSQQASPPHAALLAQQRLGFPIASAQPHPSSPFPSGQSQLPSSLSSPPHPLSVQDHTHPAPSASQALEPNKTLSHLSNLLAMSSLIIKPPEDDEKPERLPFLLRSQQSSDGQSPEGRSKKGKPFFFSASEAVLFDLALFSPNVPSPQHHTAHEQNDDKTGKA